MRQQRAKEIARQVEIERVRYKRTRPQMPEIYEGYRIVSPEIEEPVIRVWWEVGYIMPNGIRRTEKHSDQEFAVKRYMILEELRTRGLQFHSVNGNVRKRIDTQ